MDDIRIITIKNYEEDIVIRIPKELLVFAQSRREEPITILDENDMSTDFVENFIDFGETETDISKFHSLLDDWFVSRLEEGANYLKGWWEDNE